MSYLDQFSLPIQGLDIGFHEYRFVLENSFFENFENSPITEADIVADLNLEKRHNMLILDFDYLGFTLVNCDRCLSKIKLPIDDKKSLIIKYSTEASDPLADIIYISPEAHELNVARFLFENAVLSLPISKTKNCEDEDFKDCDLTILNKLDEETNLEKKETRNPLWDDLQNIKFEKN